MKRTYEVLVGNIGLVHSGANRNAAFTCFQSYVESSKAAFGRASGEDVTLMQDGEPINEYFGTKERF